MPFKADMRKALKRVTCNEGENQLLYTESHEKSYLGLNQFIHKVRNPFNGKEMKTSILI